MINARKLPRHTHRTHGAGDLSWSLGFSGGLATIATYLANFFATEKLLQKKLQVNYRQLDGLLGAMTQPPHVAATKRRQRRSCSRSRSQLRRRHHRIALIDCVYATQLLHSLCFGGFGFSFSFSLFVSFSFCFRFLGRAILRCHMLHATCHMPHSTLD